MLVTTHYSADEFFQCTEVAFQSVYSKDGATERTWEWRPCVEIRSAIHPGLFTAFLWMLKTLRVDSHWMVVRMSKERERERGELSTSEDGRTKALSSRVCCCNRLDIVPLSKEAFGTRCWNVDGQLSRCDERVMIMGFATHTVATLLHKRICVLCLC